MNNIYILYIYYTHILTIQVRTGQFWRVSNPFLPLATWEGHDCIPLKEARENDQNAPHLPGKQPAVSYSKVCETSPTGQFPPGSSQFHQFSSFKVGTQSRCCW